MPEVVDLKKERERAIVRSWLQSVADNPDLGQVYRLCAKVLLKLIEAEKG